MLKRAVEFLALFSSLSTLICCAIPALLVSLGLGATLVSTLAAVPQLIWFSEHKVIVFSVAGVLLMAAALLRGYSARLSCPADPLLANSCGQARDLSKWIFYMSVVMYAVGIFFAFVAPLMYG